MQRLQWQISKSIISVLSTIEKKWDPYQLDYPIDSNLKNYVNVWFHLVTVCIVCCIALVDQVIVD